MAHQSTKPDLILSGWYRQFASALTRPSQRNGRVLVVAIVLTYFGVIAISSLFTDYVQFWSTYLGVPAVRPQFLDLRQLAAGALCTELGYDPLLTNPCDPLGRPYNYPRIWIRLTAAVGLTQDRITMFGVGLAVLFFATALVTLGRLT